MSNKLLLSLLNRNSAFCLRTTKIRLLQGTW